MEAQMANLPTVGGSHGTWGDKLNTYLRVEHTAGGTHGAITPTSVTSTGRIKGTFINLGTPSTLTISSGSITPTRSYHSVAVESGTTDNLDTIATTNASPGDLLVLYAAVAGKNIVVRDVTVSGTGNIFLSDNASFTMNHNTDRIMFVFGGSNWIELSRSNNG